MLKTMKYVPVFFGTTLTAALLPARVVHMHGHLRGILVTAEPKPIRVPLEKLMLHDARLARRQRTGPMLLTDEKAFLHVWGGGFQGA